MILYKSERILITRRTVVQAKILFLDVESLNMFLLNDKGQSHLVHFSCYSVIFVFHLFLLPCVSVIAIQRLLLSIIMFYT